MRSVLKLCLLFLLLTTLSAVSAQEAEPAQFRVFQIFANSASASLDGDVVVDSLLYPFVSDYIAITPDAHSLTISNDDPDAANSQSLDFEAAAGHRYTAVALNNKVDYTDFQISLIDETELLAGMTGDSNQTPVIVVHDVVDAPALDIYIDDEIVVSGLEFGDTTAFPTGTETYHARATPAGDPQTVIYESDYTGFANALSLIGLVGEAPDSFFVVASNSSELPVADFLAAQDDHPDSFYHIFYEMLVQSDVIKELTDEGQFTLFIPNDEAFASVPDDQREALLNDPEAFSAWVRQYIVAERIPAAQLPEHETLTTLAGTELALAFPNDNYWNLNGTANIINDVRVSNGVLYQIDALLPPVS